MGCEAGYEKIPSQSKSEMDSINCRLSWDDVTAGHLIGCRKKSKIMRELSST